MGAGASSVMGPEGEGAHQETAMGDLPENCIATMLMGMGPAEICRLARINRTFRAAAAADFIWEEKLPDGYGRFVERVLGAEESKKVSARGKKVVYSRLCRRNLFDGGTKVQSFDIDCVWSREKAGPLCLVFASFFSEFYEVDFVCLGFFSLN